jgi:hypothetical protein
LDAREEVGQGLAFDDEEGSGIVRVPLNHHIPQRENTVAEGVVAEGVVAVGVAAGALGKEGGFPFVENDVHDDGGVSGSTFSWLSWSVTCRACKIPLALVSKNGMASEITRATPEATVRILDVVPLAGAVSPFFT